MLYGIQCTGNGHITRSISLITELRKHAQVDVVTSGLHSEVNLPFDVRYKLKGLNFFFGSNGGFDVVQTIRNNNMGRLYKEIQTLPTEKYDMVISDFEPVSAWSAKLKQVYCASISNQATLTYKDIPKPTSFYPLSKMLIQALCNTSTKYGLFYTKENDHLFFPPIRKEIQSLNTSNKEFYVVYLPFYSDERIIKNLTAFKKKRWLVYSKNAIKAYQQKNVRVMPISNDHFIQSLAHCEGVLCSASFGTTSEALYLKKKLLVIPMKNQYEQQCNAHNLNKIGIPSIKSLKPKHHHIIKEWLKKNTAPNIEFTDETKDIVHRILSDYIVNERL